MVIEDTRPYEALCRAVSREEGWLKLSVSSQGWVVEVILGPTQHDPAWRATAVLFPSITELDRQVERLCAWVQACREPAIETHESSNQWEERSR